MNPSERRQYRIGTPDWFDRESQPDPFAEAMLRHPDPLAEDWNPRTVDIRGPVQCHINDEFEDAGWVRAKYVWMFLLGLVLGYALGRFVMPWVLGA